MGGVTDLCGRVVGVIVGEWGLLVYWESGLIRNYIVENEKVGERVGGDGLEEVKGEV